MSKSGLPAVLSMGISAEKLWDICFDIVASQEYDAMYRVILLCLLLPAIVQAQFWKPGDNLTGARSNTAVSPQGENKQLYQYKDPKTKQWVIRYAPPRGYEWKELQTTKDNVKVIEITGRKPYQPPQASGTRIPGVFVRGSDNPSPPRTTHQAPIAEDFEFSQKLADACFDGIRPSFFDPYSARMDRHQTYRMPDGGVGVVVWLNAKNRFGAYVGSKPFHCYRTASKELKVGEGEL
jgi:hypothetical protein